MIGISPLDFGNITPYEFMQAYKGYLWGRQRLLKDMAWLMATLSNTCGYPSKKRKKLRPEDFIRFTADKELAKNPFYLNIMDIKRR